MAIMRAINQCFAAFRAVLVEARAAANVLWIGFETCTELTPPACVFRRHLSECIRKMKSDINV